MIEVVAQDRAPKRDRVHRVADEIATANNLARLHPSGSVDFSFASPLAPDQTVTAIARQPEASNDIRGNMILTAALVEGAALFAIIVGFLAMVI